MIRIIRATALALPLAACSTGPAEIGGDPNLQVWEGDLPAPSSTDQFETQGPYLVGPADVLRVDVVGFPDFSNRQVRVDQNGTISYPLAGTMSVTGKTTEQIAEQISTAMQGNFVREPQVTVNLETPASRTVTVYGEVRDPGEFQLDGSTTLLGAIAKAKGLTEFARQDDVVVFRTVQGQKMATLYNLKAIRRGYYADPAVYPNDLIAVGDNPSKRLFRDLVSAAGILTTPLTLLLQNN